MRALGGAWLLAVSAAATACPTDATPRAAEVLLTVQQPGAPTRSFGAADLAALTPTRSSQRLAVVSSAGGATERSTSYAGVLMRDLLAEAGFGGPSDRASRLAVVEAVATDGYRALFSWGELFNTAVGDQVLVVRSRDDRPLDATAGPLALRSLADLRAGARHVRNLCALLMRR